MASTPIFYFDVASPYSYLASTRAERLLGAEIEWRPILVGALHKHYRRLSWGPTPKLRAAGMAEVERRAVDYGLPEIAWPDPYPANSLVAMRAATWAHQNGQTRAFASAAFAMAFTEAVDLSTREAVLGAAERAGLDPGDADRALDDASVKLALREENELAITAGVYGVPTVDAGGLLWWGDHQLEAASLVSGSNKP